MLSIILTLACNDHYMAYPVDKIQDTEEETIEDPVDTVDIHENTTDTDDYEDTGYEEPVEETDEPVEETDEAMDTGYEEPVEETDETDEVEEEDTDTGSTIITVPTDNYNYSDDWTLTSISFNQGMPYYANDYGWTMIDSYSSLICGLQSNGRVDCFCDNASLSICNSPAYDVMDYIPFQQFVDVSVVAGQICAIDANGSALCWDNNGLTFNLPQFSPYVDVVSLQQAVCGLDIGGALYCFDTGTGGVIYSGTTAFKAIEGKESRVCGVLDNGLGMECLNFNLSTPRQRNTPNWHYTTTDEIIGMDVGHGGMCYSLMEDVSQMQTIQCVPSFLTQSNSISSVQSCLGSAPHEYYYDFFINNTDLSNVEVGGTWGIGGFYDPSQNLTVLWGGRYSMYMGNVITSPVNNGYWTGSGCDYYWGN